MHRSVGAHPKPRKEAASDLFWAEWERKGHEVVKVPPAHFGAGGEKASGFQGKDGVFLLRVKQQQS